MIDMFFVDRVLKRYKITLEFEYHTNSDIMTAKETVRDYVKRMPVVKDNTLSFDIRDIGWTKG